MIFSGRLRRGGEKFSGGGGRVRNFRGVGGG